MARRSCGSRWRRTARRAVLSERATCGAVALVEEELVGAVATDSPRSAGQLDRARSSSPRLRWPGRSRWTRGCSRTIGVVEALRGLSARSKARPAAGHRDGLPGSGWPPSPVRTTNEPDRRHAPSRAGAEHLALVVREDRRVAGREDLLARARRAGRAARGRRTGTAPGPGTRQRSPTSNRRPPTVWWLTSGSRLRNVSKTPSNTPSGVETHCWKLLARCRTGVSWRRRPASISVRTRVEDLLSRLVDDRARVREAEPEADAREMQVDRERLRPAMLAEVVGVDRPARVGVAKRRGSAATMTNAAAAATRPSQRQPGVRRSHTNASAGAAPAAATIDSQ